MKVDEVIAKRLLAGFLDELSDRFGSDGCNDWEWPDWVPADQRRAIKAHHPDREAEPDFANVQRVEMNHDVLACLMAALEITP